MQITHDVSSGRETSKLGLGIYPAIKSVADFCMAAALMVVAAPIIAVLAMLVKRASPGPVFYTQTRQGLHGRPFKIWKLRTKPSLATMASRIRSCSAIASGILPAFVGVDPGARALADDADAGGVFVGLEFWDNISCGATARRWVALSAAASTRASVRRLSLPEMAGGVAVSSAISSWPMVPAKASGNQLSVHAGW